MVGMVSMGAIRWARARRKQIKFNYKLKENKLDYLIKKPDAQLTSEQNHRQQQQPADEPVE